MDNMGKASIQIHSKRSIRAQGRALFDPEPNQNPQGVESPCVNKTEHYNLILRISTMPIQPSSTIGLVDAITD